MNYVKKLFLYIQILFFAAVITGCSSMLDEPVSRNAGITTASPSGGYSVAMLNGTLDITVVLNKKPLADVTINAHLSDSTYVSIPATKLTFTPYNWNIPQVITITGGGYALPIPNQNTSLVFDTAQSFDPVYNNMFTPSIPVVVIGNIPGITVSPITGLKTYKSGTTLHAAATFTVVLNTKPSANVTLSSIASSAVNQGTIDKSSLTFNTLNWNTPQVITVTGVDNGVAGEGNVPYTVNFGTAAVSGDAAYNGMTPSSVSVTNMDDLTRPELIVTPNAVSNSVPMMLIETATGGALGASGTFTVSLASAPSNTVIYNITSSISGKVKINTLSQTTVTFTTSNWNTPQTFTVTPVTNHTGNSTLSIIVGSDASILANTVPVTVLDNTAPNVIVTSLSNPTDGVTSAYFDVYLTTAPAQNVTIPINERWDAKNSSNQQGTINKTSLTFTSANYSTPQRVTVTGVDDHIVNGNIQYYIYLGNTVSADSSYNGIKPRNVTVNNNEINIAGIVPNKTNGFATDSQGNLGSANATFTICLNSKPKAPVRLTLTCPSGYGTLSTNTLNFTTSDTSWNTPQTVSVIGNSNGAGHAGDYTITTSITTTDPEYNALSGPVFTIYNCDNTNNLVAYCRLSGSSMTTTQGGGTASFWLIPKTIPSSITIPVSSSNVSAGGTVLPASVNLTSSNWNTLGASNKVTVTGVYSGDFETNVVYSIIFGASSGDFVYTVPSVSVTNMHISLLTVSSVTTSTDLGGIGSFTVKLNVQPSGDVNFTVNPGSYATGTGLTSGSIGSSVNLTFTSANWNTPQTVYIQGDIYNGVRGDKTSTVTFGAIISSDPGMSGYTPPGSNAVTCKEANKLVWVSNKTYVGNFNGGITQVDFNSTDATDTNRPTGIGAATYKALIADGSSRVATTDGSTDAGQTGWVLKADTTYYLKTGSMPYITVIFTTNSYRLFTTLNTAFPVDSSDTFWTGLNSDLTSATYNCGQWKNDATEGDYWKGGTTDLLLIKSATQSANTVPRKLIFVQQ